MAASEPSTGTSDRRRALLAVAVIALAACALRVSSLGRSLWLDEAWRANIALAPSWDAFWNAVLGAGDGGVGAPMPPLFALLLRAAGFVVHHSAVGMRAIPVLASIAAVPLAYVVARRAGGTRAGLAAALAFAASPTTLLHGQELKQYSTDIMAVLILLTAASAVEERPAAREPWVVLALTASLAPGLAYPTALVLPGIALATLAICRTTGDRMRWLAAQTVIGLAAVAWYVLLIGPQRQRPRVSAYWAADFPTAGGVPGAGWVAANLLDFVRYCSAEPVWLAAPLVLLGLAWRGRWLGLAALGSVATLIAAALWGVYPLSGGRTSVFLLPFVYLGLALSRGVGGALAAFVLLAMVVRGVHAPHAGLVYEETAPLIATLAAERQPNDRVYVYDGAVQAFRFQHPASDPLITLGGSYRNDETKYAVELKPLLVPGQRLWLLFAHVHAPVGGRTERETILGDLALTSRQIAVHEAPGASLHLFEVLRAPSSVRHLTLTPEDIKDPERLKALLGR